jgi:hypothetical protein
LEGGIISRRFSNLAALACAAIGTAALITAGLATATLGAGSAHAAGRALIGGGSGIIIDGEYECTLTAIGHDATGQLVGLTAGHCGSPGSRVVAESDPNAGQIGTFAYADHNELDYAVIVFDPSRVIPERRVGPVTITNVGAPANFPDIVCKQGRTTGNTCGVAWGDVFDSKTDTWTQLCVVEGDSGAPIMRGDTLVGMVNAYLAVACLGPEVGTSISAVLRDIDAHHLPGAGFRLI